MRFFRFAILPTSVALAALLFAPAATAAETWPNWRGPTQNGVAPDANPPTTWSETQNVKWKVPLPGYGQSTPVIWGERLFILTAMPASGRPLAGEASEGRRMTTGKPDEAWKFEIVCLDRHTGEILWRQTAAAETPQEGHHPTGSFAPYSPVTDGKHVWASFGSRGLHCYTVSGEHIWSKPLAKMSTRRGFGEGSSPALAGGAIIVVQDHEGPSRIAAYNKLTGEILWEKPRDEISAWSTPHPVKVEDTTQIIVNATGRIRSYDLANGDVIWECGGMTVNVIPTPVSGFGNAYCASGFRGAALTAIPLDSKGDVTGQPAWNIDRGTPYVPSPLLYGDRLYFIDGLNNRLSCADAKTGKLLFNREGLEGLGQVYASPLGAGGHVYVAGRDGAVAVLKDDAQFTPVATNRLDDGFDASPVAVGDTLYLKGNRHLYSIAAP